MQQDILQLSRFTDLNNKNKSPQTCKVTLKAFSQQCHSSEVTENDLPKNA